MRASWAVVLLLALPGCFTSPSTQAEGQAALTSGLQAEAAADVPPAVPVQAAGGPQSRLAPAVVPFPAGAEPLRLLRTIDTASAGPAKPFEAFDALSLNVADLRGDGRLQVVTMNDNLRTYVLDPRTGTILAELATARPDGDRWGARDINGVAVGDVAGPGTPGLAILNSAATLTLLQLDPEASTADHFGFTTLWERRVSPLPYDPHYYETHPWEKPGSVSQGADGNPFLAHLPDGSTVVLAQSDGSPAHLAFNGNGTMRWFTDYWDGNAGPWAGPLVPGGPLRAVFSTDGGHVVAYDVASGRIRWDFDAPAHGATPGSIPVMPGVFDLRGDGRMSVLVGARVAVDDHTEGWMARQHAAYFLLDPDGKMLWTASYPWGNPNVYMHPAAVDVSGDGVKDLVVLDWNTIGHKPGNWEKLWAANLFAIDGATGEALWRTPIDAQWSNTGIAIADFLPQPGLEVLVPEQSGGRDGLSLVGLGGRHLGWMPLPGTGWAVRRGPVLADVDGDGLAEAIVPVSRGATGCTQDRGLGCRAGALLVYGTQAPDGLVAYDNNHRFDSATPDGLAVARPS
ncbi:MAG TPA: hypothetical protein VM286_00535 [Candidatus Thermoplasmatota archaeon]|nr:hypothetical protein [Candidatus Thermoplasmatota archaeon]